MKEDVPGKGRLLSMELSTALIRKTVLTSMSTPRTWLPIRMNLFSSSR